MTRPTLKVNDRKKTLSTDLSCANDVYGGT